MMSPLLLVLVALVSCASSATTPTTPTAAPTTAPTNLSSLQSQVLTSLATSLLDSPYNSQVRPDLDKRVPITVNISVFITEVTAMNEVNMDFSTSMYFRRIWKDERLAYSSSLTDVLSIGFMVDRIWQPDIYFRNEKAGMFHTVTVPNIMLLVYPDGRVILSTKYTLSLSCQFQLALYPMDSQVCNIEFGSYGYQTSDIILSWNDNSAVVLSEVARSLPEYEIDRADQHDCTTGYELTGRFTCLRVSLHMKRKFNYYLIQVYIPSTLVVVLSWVSFWIDHHATPARITLSLLTVLTITTQSSSVTSGMPRVSYVKSIDVWLTGCLTFVFMALIQYAVVNVVQRRSGMLRTAEKWQKPKKMLGVAKTIRNAAAQRAVSVAALAKGSELPAATPAAVAVAATTDVCSFKGSNSEGDFGSGNLATTGTTETGSQPEPATTTGGVGSGVAPQTEQVEQNSKHKTLGWLLRNKPAIVHWLGLQCFRTTEVPTSSGMSDAEFVDFLAKRIFPAAFLVFNAVYWSYYKTMQFLSA